MILPRSSDAREGATEFPLRLGAPLSLARSPTVVLAITIALSAIWEISLLENVTRMPPTPVVLDLPYSPGMDLRV
jgi:hypothetical protein